VIVIYKKKYKEKLYQAFVGTIVKMNTSKAQERINEGVVEQYFGLFPPRDKVKINLKDLK
jgi:hypothetical protein